MVEMTLYCVVVGEGSVFAVKIFAHETVATLKDLIKGKKPRSIACDADRLDLYSIEGLIQNKDDQFVYNGTTIDMANCTLKFFGGKSKMGTRSLVSECLKDVNAPWKIHVLVDRPDEDSSKVRHVTVKESDVIEHLKELTYYQQRGRLIHDNCKDYCDSILNKVEEFYSMTNPLPFICVEGSSGVGKSQLAFALHSKRLYFYLLATPVGLEAQILYQNFASISGEFDEFVKLDDPTRKSEADILNTRSLFYEQGELWTYGFIRALLKYCSSENLVNGSMIHFANKTSLHVTKCTLEDVRETIAGIKNLDKLLPFFILDEMSPNVKIAGGKNSAAFQRNIFRVCGLVVFVMGTNSKVTNLVAHSTGSYSEMHLWMAIRIGNILLIDVP
ncbi:Aste57867_20667 [Aphanomyces stellatus]|uniref:Aste57867_20667 protein n=1 Tax=Aphanomyces stellatus TaxID=120398 RepID=A0A485LGR8_9STRA|nr:hypothetical protein As57867_020599 [Aphanomyces stellatus]VFT97347.1 Aste57867_20667 [Aphanomyces stellatus]